MFVYRWSRNTCAMNGTKKLMASDTYLHLLTQVHCMHTYIHTYDKGKNGPTLWIAVKTIKFSHVRAFFGKAM